VKGGFVASLIVLVAASVAHGAFSPTAIPYQPPVRNGLVFQCGDEKAEIERLLSQWQHQGYNLIVFSADMNADHPEPKYWAKLENILTWCDKHEMPFFLLHGMQYGSTYGGYNKEVLDPESVLWQPIQFSNALKGHPCVAGLVIGNEVNPGFGTPQEAPVLWQRFREWLSKQYERKIEALNDAWDTVRLSRRFGNHQGRDQDEKKATAAQTDEWLSPRNG